MQAASTGRVGKRGKVADAAGKFAQSLAAAGAMRKMSAEEAIQEAVVAEVTAMATAKVVKAATAPAISAGRATVAAVEEAMAAAMAAAEVLAETSRATGGEPCVGLRNIRWDIGARVCKWWAADKRWFPGTVLAATEEIGRHLISPTHL